MLHPFQYDVSADSLANFAGPLKGVQSNQQQQQPPLTCGKCSVLTVRHCDEQGDQLYDTENQLQLEMHMVNPMNYDDQRMTINSHTHTLMELEYITSIRMAAYPLRSAPPSRPRPQGAG